NHDFMARITFANQRMKNLLAPGREGGMTRMAPDAEPVTIFEAAESWRRQNVPLIVLAGADYGMGSSRDWAAKGPKLLGVRAVVAESFERIHRANLIGMGILPMTFAAGESASSLGLSGFESYDFDGLRAAIETDRPVTVTARTAGGEARFSVRVDVASSHERALLQNGGLFASLLAGVDTRRSAPGQGGQDDT
ncbi:MAG: aconitate hydratase, partial [Nitratireductor sp.]